MATDTAAGAAGAAPPVAPPAAHAPADASEHVVRYRRAARRFHTATYLVTFVLLGTGWWIRTGHEDQPSALAELTGVPDGLTHRRAGWVLVALVGLGVTAGVRAAVTFVRQTVRVERGDARWFRGWPVGAVTGRFAHHRGHFDPGQRLANIGFVASFGTLVVTGIGLTVVSAGPDYATLLRLHRAATYVLTVLVVVHLVVAIGVLPGYRGAWRAMHLRGRTPLATARRLWPATVEADDPRPPPPK